MARPATLALTVLLASTAATVAAAQTPPSPNGAATPTTGAGAPATPPATPAPTAGTAASTAGERTANAAVERHIATLHSQLAITAAQEPAWNDFASVMRRNVSDMDDRLTQRRAAFGTLDAVDDLRSYADLEAARAAGIGRLVGPFSTLYAELTPAQKTTADRLFRQQAERHARHVGG